MTLTGPDVTSLDRIAEVLRSLLESLAFRLIPAMASVISPNRHGEQLNPGHLHNDCICSTRARQGKSACKGRSISMDKLDTLVTDNLIEQLFRPERLKIILGK